MVSLDARNQFIDDLRSSASSCFTLALVLGEDCPSAEPATVADRASLSIISNDEAKFSEVVQELESRRIKADADWVLDDFLLFALLVGAHKFGCGNPLCKAIIGARRPSNEQDIALNDAMRGLSCGAFAVEGPCSFAKLVFCELTGELRIDKPVARRVYSELTRRGRPDELSTFPRLLAYRAFDLLVRKGIEDQLTSVDAIVAAIEERSDKMSIGEWGRIAFAMRPSAIAWVAGILIAISTAAFSAGMWFASPAGSNSVESSQKAIPTQESKDTDEAQKPD